MKRIVIIMVAALAMLASCTSQKGLKVLAIVDPQNDFIDGALAVGMDPWLEAYSSIENLLETGEYDMVIMTKDWHPENHCSFVEQGGPWPAHCVAGTEGAEPYCKLKDVADLVILKGDKPELEEYGVDLLKSVDAKVARVDVVGLCYDYCVASCANMTAESHPEVQVVVIKSGTVAIDPAAEPDFGGATVE